MGSVVYILYMLLVQGDPPVFLLCLVFTSKSRLDGTVAMYFSCHVFLWQRKPIFKMPGPEIVQNELPGSTQPEEDPEVQSFQVCVIRGSRIYLPNGICGCHTGLIILIICCMLSSRLKNICQCLWDELLHYLLQTHPN